MIFVIFFFIFIHSLWTWDDEGSDLTRRCLSILPLGAKFLLLRTNTKYSCKNTRKQPNTKSDIFTDKQTNSRENEKIETIDRKIFRGAQKCKFLYMN